MGVGGTFDSIDFDHRLDSMLVLGIGWLGKEWKLGVHRVILCRSRVGRIP